VSDGASLTLADGITLKGITSPHAPIVAVNTRGTFVMEAGSTISDNMGGGVEVAGGIFTMRGGIITNTTGFNGGGVYVESGGTFTMTGGKIAKNTATNNGGGVYVGSGGTFSKAGSSVIYGKDNSTATDNTITGGSLGDGYAVYVYVDGTNDKYRDNTAGVGDNLNSSGLGLTVSGGSTYTVTFNSNGGTSVLPVTGITSGSKITEPVVADRPTKSGYDSKFAGWYKESSCINPWVFTTDTVTSHTTIYAKWSEYNVGDTGPGGGKVFYKVTPSGFPMADGGTCYYLEAALVDVTTESTLKRWTSYFSPYDSIPAVEDPEIGSGRNNTRIILLGTNDSSAPAALACTGYTGGGKNDWFLPSRDELKKLYEQKNLSGFSGSWKTNVGNGTTEIPSSYWASTQVNDSCAYTVDFKSGTVFTSDDKGYLRSVRPIRAF
jgi:uncharacterized repeat protein (TIGR02543 family)